MNMYADEARSSHDITASSDRKPWATPQYETNLLLKDESGKAEHEIPDSSVPINTSSNEHNQHTINTANSCNGQELQWTRVPMKNEE
jgi:hypothetical protein